MQIDFHHAVTYVLARLADFTHEDAAIIAYSAQYVDDAQNRGTIEFTTGKTFDHIASSHSVYDVKNDLRSSEDYQVWVPFHFLPGNNGDEADTGQDLPVDQRLLCQPDSPLATDMCRAAFETNLYRLGITTHVYADTWAHQRFSGVRNHINEAHDETHEAVIERIEAFAADIAGLGHGAVSGHPDQPFRVWSYRNCNGNEVTRSNPDIYIQACERIFELHVAYRGEGGTRQLQAQDRALLYDSLDYLIRQTAMFATSSGLTCSKLTSSLSKHLLNNRFKSSNTALRELGRGNTKPLGQRTGRIKLATSSYTESLSRPAIGSCFTTH